MEIVVIVQDVQDQPPVFTLAPPVTKLPPGILPGDKVIIADSNVATRVPFKVYIFLKILQVHAEDGDKGNPREVRYGLVSENNPFTSFFDINDTSGKWIYFILRIYIKLVTSLGPLLRQQRLIRCKHKIWHPQDAEMLSSVCYNCIKRCSTLITIFMDTTTSERTTY